MNKYITKCIKLNWMRRSCYFRHLWDPQPYVSSYLKAVRFKIICYGLEYGQLKNYTITLYCIKLVLDEQTKIILDCQWLCPMDVLYPWSVPLRIQSLPWQISLLSLLFIRSRDSFTSVAAVWPPVSVRTELFLTFEWKTVQIISTLDPGNNGFSFGAICEQCAAALRSR